MTAESKIGLGEPGWISTECSERPAIWEMPVNTTDGHKAYLDAVEGAFGANVDQGN
jgi:hypothetical protein